MATDAEGDESDVGEISGGEEPEVEFTDRDALRRLPSDEAPQLVGTDSYDEESDKSRDETELSETHGSYPGECDAACNNDYNIDCKCKCERCMFKYLNLNPANERMFKTLLNRNFRSSGNWYLTDPYQRIPRARKGQDVSLGRTIIFRARRPYDCTQESDTQPCTQMIPWGCDICEWEKPCPNKRRREQGRYHGRILPCDEVLCGSSRHPTDPPDLTFARNTSKTTKHTFAWVKMQTTCTTPI